jgi:hypothetical protein
MASSQLDALSPHYLYFIDFCKTQAIRPLPNIHSIFKPPII